MHMASAALRAALLTCLVATTLGGCAGREEAEAVAEEDPVVRTRQRVELAARYGADAPAMDAYRATLRDDPVNRDALIGTGEILLRYGDAAGALRAFENVLERSPDDLDAREGRALAALGLGRHASAREQVAAVLAADAQRWRMHNAAGMLEDLAGNYAQAQESYRAALALRPDEPVLWNNLGWSQLMARDYPAAEQSLREGLARGRNERLVNNLVLAVAWQGDYGRALRVAGDALPVHEAYNNVGYVAMLREDYAEAESYFRKAIDTSPGWFAQAAANLERVQVLRSAPRADR